MSSPRAAVVVRLSALQAPSARTVVAAALQLFGPADPVDVVLVLPGVQAVTEEHGAPVVELVHGLGLGALPEVLLQGEGEASGLQPVVTVEASGDPVADARAVVLLGAAAQQLWEPAPEPVPVEALRELEREVERALAARDRARALERVARRDLRRAGAGERRPLVVLVLQHRSYWGALATLHEALAERPEVDTAVVALDSRADGRTESTARFLTEQGVASHDVDWLSARLGQDAVDVVVHADPYDETRPACSRVAALAERGVRVVAVPYGNNTLSGELMDRAAWDRPLQRLAWRSYVASDEQVALHEQHCATGGAHARAVGTPKTDRVVLTTRGEREVPGVRAFRDVAAGRPVVLWNPHFHVGPGGWSTFATHLEPLLAHARRDDRAVLLVRPHFRLFLELRRSGLAHLEDALRAAAAELPHLLLDEGPDYLPALAAADAVLSDLSSLATEVLPSGTPVLHLHRPDAPALTGEGSALYAAMYRAERWEEVAAFLDAVVRGHDPRREERAAEVRRLLPLVDGHAGERVAEDLVGSLLAELHPLPATCP